MIIDVNYDPYLIEYFTSFEMWHTSIAGPSNTDIVDWNSWFKLSRKDADNTKFLLSPDCNVCEENHIRQHYDTKSTYWMSGNLFGCYWMILGKHNCDLDKDTYACYDCSPQTDGDEDEPIEITEDSDPTSYYYSGQCATAIRSSNSEVTSSHDTCQLGLHWTFGNVNGDDYENLYDTNVVTKLSSTASDAGVDSTFESEIFKPSLGTDGRFCVCQQSNNINYYQVNKNELKTAMDRFGDDINTYHQFNDNYQQEDNAKDKDDKETKTEEIIPKTSKNNRVELTSSDFESGTYRITESGTYVIVEDIEFDFNAGSLDDPQASGGWKPSSSQIDEYPGAETGRDEYFLGFFAGITIECDDVVLDLNGYSIGMSEVFYHQQRWFTVISLTSQFFLPGNGPGFFGYDPKYASNVIIKNGVIGLSSHFGIHGNYNSDVLIENVQVKEFEVHGMQFNGFEGLTIRNVEVGPSSKKAYMTGEYGHMRYVLDRLNKAIDQLDDDGVMNFYGREAITLKELSSKCERMMNYVFDYVVNDIRLTEDDFNDDNTNAYTYGGDFGEYSDALDIFYNPSGIPYASVLHGIFLNTKEASVMTYNLYTSTYSETATLENIKIHDLYHAMDEHVRVYNGVYMFFGPFLNSLSARQLVGDDAVDMGADGKWGSTDIPYTYKGSIVTDVYMALTKYSNNWDYLEKMLTGVHTLLPWSEGESLLPDDTNIACNMDVMIHSGKGTTGLRLDGVKDVSVTGLEIYNLHDSTLSGETVCGEYEGFDSTTGGGHVAQQAPMQVGFSGNRVQAVTFNSAYNINIINVNIHDIESETGPVTGLTIWPANEITFNGEFKFYNFKPATKINRNDDKYNKLPNLDHYSCATYFYSSYYASSTQYTNDIIFDPDSIYSCNVNDIVKDDETDWISNCFKYSDEDSQVYHDIDTESDLYSFLSKSNGDYNSNHGNNCQDAELNQNNVKILTVYDIKATSTNTVMYGGIAVGLLVFVGVMIRSFYCKQKNDKINYTPITDYGTL